jgi:hypothetical protein
MTLTALRTYVSRVLTTLALAFAMALGLGCARIYRPITLVPPPTTRTAGEVTLSVDFQPWGDNSRYEAHAHENLVRLMVLSATNGTNQEVRVALDPASVPGEWLSPARGLALLKQSFVGYALLPTLSLLLFPPGQTGAWSAMANAVSGISLGTTLVIAISNAAVAASSNRKLEEGFTRNAWADGPLPPGETRQGLLLFRAYDPQAPARLRFRIEGPGGVRVQELLMPGSPKP